MITESITEAKNALDNIEQLGETGFNICDGVLMNIKAFVHDQDIWDNINEKEKQVHIEFQKQLEEARKKLKDMDPMFSWQKGMTQYMKLRQWKSMELISFFDKLNKEHEL